MKTTVSSDQMRAIDKNLEEEFLIPSLILMENAGRGVAETIGKMITPAGPVALFCGTGNNGGDGFVAARHLLLKGFQPRVFLAREESDVSGDAKTNLLILKRLGLPVETFRTDRMNHWRELCQQSRLVVDALLGTGRSGPIREPYATLIRLINGSGRPVAAVDLPSGLDPDTGVPGDPTVKATVTVTMGLAKKGLLAKAASAFVGKLEVVDLGIPISTHSLTGG